MPWMILLIVAWALVVDLLILPKPLDMHFTRLFGETMQSFWQFILLLIALIPVHEFPHALAPTGYGTSRTTFNGF